GGAEGDFDYPLLDFLNVKYFLTFKEQGLVKNFPLAVEDENYKLYLNPNFFPRAFLVYDYTVIPDGKTALSKLKSGQITLDKTVVFEEEPLINGKLIQRPSESGQVIFERYNANEALITAQAPENGFLVFSDNHYPGWEAFLDGKRTKILRANYSFRGIVIPKGEHRVHFVYRPRSFFLGLLVSGTFLVLMVLLGFALWQKRKADSKLLV
ncbi:MAG: YfhO family protein, partial [Candidatus Omnitrophica bacterium]|nr:YfhO family protein [Candidatus Omnitrophota bacterium]